MPFLYRFAKQHYHGIVNFATGISSDQFEESRLHDFRSKGYPAGHIDARIILLLADDFKIISNFGSERQVVHWRSKEGEKVFRQILSIFVSDAGRYYSTKEIGARLNAAGR